MNARTNTAAADVVTFSEASRTRGTPLLIGIAGPPGSGKTLSALRIATGLADGGPVGVIDTENRRALQYADRYHFLHADLQPPFSPARYLTALRQAEAAGMRVVVVDSASHEHEGEGGILDMHEAELQRMAGNDYGMRDKMKFTAWIKPKAEHGALVRFLERTQMHVILCMRAKDKLVMAKNAKGKQEPVSIGWTPIVADRLDYAMTLTLILPPRGQGKPKLDELSTKIDSYAFGRIVTDGGQLTEETGRGLLAWSRGESAAAPAEREKAAARPAEKPAARPAEKPAAPAASNDEATVLNDVPTRSKALVTGREMLARLREVATLGAYNTFIEREEERLDWYRANKPEIWKHLEEERLAAFARCQPGREAA